MKQTALSAGGMIHLGGMADTLMDVLPFRGASTGWQETRGGQQSKTPSPAPR